MKLRIVTIVVGLMVVGLMVIGPACDGDGSGATGDPQTDVGDLSFPDVDPGDGTPSCNLPESRRVVRGSFGTEKICQLTGESDRERDEYTHNRTLTNAGLWGTDLGVSFEHDGRLWFLFGDSIGDAIEGEDAIAWTDDDQPGNCIALQFLLGEDGTWLTPTVPDVSLGAFEVPLDGVSYDGNMYVYFSTDHSEAHVMGRSVLARSSDNGQSFERVADISTLGAFINVSVDVVNNADWAGVPDSTGQGLLIWGSGEYRQSSVSLAWQPLADIENPETIQYLTGLSADGCTPLWSDSEADAQPLFDEDCVGELSVEWNPHLSKWVMTYNCIDPRGIRFRTADQPWGPWSESQNLFHPWEDGGYCHFIHTSFDHDECDDVHDPGRERDWGGEYGPYQIAPYAEPISGGSVIYFVMSTWNPYNVVLMRSELVLE